MTVYICPRMGCGWEGTETKFKRIGVYQVRICPKCRVQVHIKKPGV